MLASSFCVKCNVNRIQSVRPTQSTPLNIIHMIVVVCIWIFTTILGGKLTKKNSSELRHAKSISGCHFAQFFFLLNPVCATVTHLCCNIDILVVAWMIDQTTFHTDILVTTKQNNKVQINKKIKISHSVDKRICDETQFCKKVNLQTRTQMSICECCWCQSQSNFKKKCKLYKNERKNSRGCRFIFDRICICPIHI